MDEAPLVFDPPIEEGVVAGYDGTASCSPVLAWALVEARAHAEALHVVRAWALADAVDDVGAPFGVVPSLDECHAAVLAATDRSVRRARTATGTDDLPVHVHVVHAPAGAALAEASRQARLLVVGHRGRGRLQLVLGSVTEHLLCHASCPVVVVALRRP
jgi:nucleotide-binding universal stress UspA family protein